MGIFGFFKKKEDEGFEQPAEENNESTDNDTSFDQPSAFAKQEEFRPAYNQNTQLNFPQQDYNRNQTTDNMQLVLTKLELINQRLEVIDRRIQEIERIAKDSK